MASSSSVCRAPKDAKLQASLRPSDPNTPLPLTTTPVNLWPLAASNGRSAKSPKIKRFSVFPTFLLRSPILNRRKYFSVSGTRRSTKMRLTAQDLKVERLKSLRRSTRLRHDAEEKSAALQQSEIDVLMLASDQNFTCASLPVELAIKLARAVREALKAEVLVAELKIQECESSLQMLRDSMEEINSLLDDSTLQLGLLLNTVRRENVPVDAETLQKPTPRAFSYETQLQVGILDEEFSEPQSPDDSDRSDCVSELEGGSDRSDCVSESEGGLDG